MSKEIEEIVEETEDEVNYVDVEIDLPESVIDYYETLAKAEGVSFNDMINIVLQKFLDDEESITEMLENAGLGNGKKEK